MGGDGVSDISAGAGEGVGRMVNEAGLISGSIARSEASGGGSTLGAETHVDNELAKVRIQGEDMETFPEDPFETGKASSLTNVTYLITTHADCKFMNLIYHLQCTECNAFYIGETSHSLFDRMNGHRFTTTVSNPDLPVAIHTQFHKIPFQECWSVSVIQKLPDSTPDLPVAIHTQSHQITFQECWSVSVIHKLPDSTPDLPVAIRTQSHHTPSLNIR